MERNQDLASVAPKEQVDEVVEAKARYSLHAFAAKVTIRVFRYNDSPEWKGARYRARRWMCGVRRCAAFYVAGLRVYESYASS